MVGCPFCAACICTFLHCTLTPHLSAPFTHLTSAYIEATGRTSWLRFGLRIGQHWLLRLVGSTANPAWEVGQAGHIHTCD